MSLMIWLSQETGEDLVDGLGPREGCRDCPGSKTPEGRERQTCKSPMFLDSGSVLF